MLIVNSGIKRKLPHSADYSKELELIWIADGSRPWDTTYLKKTIRYFWDDKDLVKN